MTGTRTVNRRALLTGQLKPTARLPNLPGVTDAGLHACTGCLACVPVCPTHVIIMVEGTPRMDFAKGECVFCGACADACPEPVFTTNRPHAFEHVVEISDSCLAVRGVACMTCRDACPSNAIRFRPRIARPFVPEVHRDSCTGCGACIGPCPASAIGVAWPERIEEAHV